VTEPPAPHQDPTVPVDVHTRSALLQVYLAEYGMITMRNTYWLTLQYALLPILGAGIAVLAQLWGQFGEDQSISSQAHRIIIWLAIVIINVIIIAHTKVGWESYNNVVYLEDKLRPKITGLFSELQEETRAAALGYETYLRKQRGKGAMWWEVPAPYISSGLFLGGIAVFGGFLYQLFGWCYGWTTVELFAVPLNAILCAQVFSVTRKMIRRRRDIGNDVPQELLETSIPSKTPPA
jgi:hypothetical protein